MKKACLWLVALSVAFVVAVGDASAVCISCTTLFEDDFDSYTLGTFPSSGGWVLQYNGTGTGNQYVGDTYSVSGSQALHLSGTSCWCALTYHPIPDLPSRVIVETNVLVEAINTGGCSPMIAGVDLWNPTQNTWGTAFGRVWFGRDGNIYAQSDVYVDAAKTLLMSYSAGTWYNVVMDVDLVSRKFDVFINGVQRGSDMDIPSVGAPTSVGVFAGHVPTSLAWFDAVKVSQPVSCGQ